MQRLLSVLMLVAVLILGSGCRLQPLQKPEFAVQAKSSSQVSAVVKEALKRRRWIIESSGAGYYVARYDTRGNNNSATIRVDYTASNITVSLVKSSGLLYEKTSDGEKIHKSYNSWVRNLQNDIQLELSHQM